MIQYKQVVIWDADVIDVGFLGSEQSVPKAIRGLAISGVYIVSGAPAAIAGQWAPSAIVYNAIDGELYKMNGTTASPTWSIIESAGDFALPVDASNTAPVDGTSSRAMRITETLPAAFGSNTVTDPRTGAAFIGRVVGSNLTKLGNYVYGLAGMYGITGTNASALPKAAVLGMIIGDGAASSTTADGAFVALIDGDDFITKAHAMLTIKVNNSIAGSGFDYGFDFNIPAAIFPGALTQGILIAEGRYSNGIKVFSGTAATRAAVRAQVGDTPLVGSIYHGSGAVGTTKPNTYIKVLNASADTDWERVVTAATD